MSNNHQTSSYEKDLEKQAGIQKKQELELDRLKSHVNEVENDSKVTIATAIEFKRQRDRTSLLFPQAQDAYDKVTISLELEEDLTDMSANQTKPRLQLKKCEKKLEELNQKYEDIDQTCQQVQEYYEYMKKSNFVSSGEFHSYAMYSKMRSNTSGFNSNISNPDGILLNDSIGKSRGAYRQNADSVKLSEQHVHEFDVNEQEKLVKERNDQIEKHELEAIVLNNAAESINRKIVDEDYQFKTINKNLSENVIKLNLSKVNEELSNAGGSQVDSYMVSDNYQSYNFDSKKAVNNTTNIQKTMSNTENGQKCNSGKGQVVMNSKVRPNYKVKDLKLDDGGKYCFCG